MDILGLAKSILPADSPWMQRIEQAQQMASQFQPNRRGLDQLLAQYGKSKDDIAAALPMLNNPIISGTLNKIAPGIVDRLQQTGSMVLNETNASARPVTQANDSMTDLRKRVDKL